MLFQFQFTLLCCKIHGFCDASERAFAAVVYLRLVYEDGSVEVILMASTIQVAPTKQQTIPRLELLGAVILSHLVSSITASLLSPVRSFILLDRFYGCPPLD